MGRPSAEARRGAGLPARPSLLLALGVRTSSLCGPKHGGLCRVRSVASPPPSRVDLGLQPGLGRRARRHLSPLRHDRPVSSGAFDPVLARAASLRIVMEAGAEQPDGISLIQPGRHKARPSHLVEERLLALMPVAGLMAGLPAEDVIEFIELNLLHTAMTPAEQALLAGDEIDEETEARLSWAAEEIAVLAWRLGALDRLDPASSAPAELTAALPAVDESADSSGWSDRLRPRPLADCLQMLDLMMVWMAASEDRFESDVDDEPFDAARSLHRLRALEWCLDPAMDW